MQVETVLLIVVALLLVDFHRRLRLLEAGVRKLLELQGVGVGSLEPSSEVKQLALAGSKIEAMRLYREQSGADVRRAKQVVEGLQRSA
jgi:ribosomal protein L7/L12